MTPPTTASDLAFWTSLMWHLLFASPILVVSLVGLVLATLRRGRHPRVSLFVVLACSLDLVGALVSPVVSALPLWFFGRGGTNVQLGTIMAAVGIVLGLLRFTALALMLAAAFSDRRTSPSQASAG